MSHTIKDGTGSGYEAAVNSLNEFKVRARTLPTIKDVSESTGLVFGLSAGHIELSTTSAFSGIVTLTNTSDVRIQIYCVRTYSSSVSTQWEMIANATAGTLFTSGTAAPAGSLNFSIPETPDATILAGANGLTVTDGFSLGAWILADKFITDFQGSLILQKGNSLTLTCKPVASCTVAACIMFTQDPDASI